MKYVYSFGVESSVFDLWFKSLTIVLYACFKNMFYEYIDLFFRNSTSGLWVSPNKIVANVFTKVQMNNFVHFCNSLLIIVFIMIHNRKILWLMIKQLITQSVLQWNDWVRFDTTHILEIYNE